MPRQSIVRDLYRDYDKDKNYNNPITIYDHIQIIDQIARDFIARHKKPTPVVKDQSIADRFIELNENIDAYMKSTAMFKKKDQTMWLYCKAYLYNRIHLLDSRVIGKKATYRILKYSRIVRKIATGKSRIVSREFHGMIVNITKNPIHDILESGRTLRERHYGNQKEEKPGTNEDDIR